MTSKSSTEIKQQIIKAGREAVEQLIIVANEKIITNTEDDLSADKLKNAAATKKLAIFDAFEILNRVDAEENSIAEAAKVKKGGDTSGDFAERFASNKK